MWEISFPRGREEIKGMTKEQILKLAVDKALENGFILKADKHVVALDDWGVKPMLGYESIIFDQEFAKCFFGEGFYHFGWDGEKWTWHEGDTFLWGKGTNLVTGLKKWEYHLQQLAIAEDRLAYLETFLIKE